MDDLKLLLMQTSIKTLLTLLIHDLEFINLLLDKPCPPISPTTHPTDLPKSKLETMQTTHSSNFMIHL